MRESPEQGEIIEMTSRLNRPMIRGGGVAKRGDREKAEKQENKRMAGLYRKRKWGKGRETPGMERFREEGRGEEQRGAIGTG